MHWNAVWLSVEKSKPQFRNSSFSIQMMWANRIDRMEDQLWPLFPVDHSIIPCYEIGSSLPNTDNGIFFFIFESNSNRFFFFNFHFESKNRLFRTHTHIATARNPTQYKMPMIKIDCDESHNATCVCWLVHVFPIVNNIKIKLTFQANDQLQMVWFRSLIYTKCHSSAMTKIEKKKKNTQIKNN